MRRWPRRLGVIADRAIRRSGRLRNPMSRTTCSPGRTKSAHATTRNRRRAHNNPAIPAGHARSTPSRATAGTPGRFHWPADWPPHVRSSSRSLPSCVFVFCVRHRLQSGRRITFQCHVPSPMVVARAPAATPSRIRPPTPFHHLIPPKSHLKVVTWDFLRMRQKAPFPTTHKMHHTLFVLRKSHFVACKWDFRRMRGHAAARTSAHSPAGKSANGTTRGMEAAGLHGVPYNSTSNPAPQHRHPPTTREYQCNNRS